MSQPNHARVLRAFALPVPAFDHLKNIQRLLQAGVNLCGTAHLVTNSEALTLILKDHENLKMVAWTNGMLVDQLCEALANGVLTLSTGPNHPRLPGGLA